VDFKEVKVPTKRVHECLYCGYTWVPSNYASYGWVSPDVKKCLKCNDRNIRVREEKTVDYYKVPEEKKKGK